MKRTDEVKLRYTSVAVWWFEFVIHGERVRESTRTGERKE